jgi:hypothetical protein
LIPVSKKPDRRSKSSNGRRALDRPSASFAEVRRELAAIKAVLEILTDAVQALTASRRKP